MIIVSASLLIVKHHPLDPISPTAITELSAVTAPPPVSLGLQTTELIDDVLLTCSSLFFVKCIVHLAFPRNIVGFGLSFYVLSNILTSRLGSHPTALSVYNCIVQATKSNVLAAC